MTMYSNDIVSEPLQEIQAFVQSLVVLEGSGLLLRNGSIYLVLLKVIFYFGPY